MAEPAGPGKAKPRQAIWRAIAPVPQHAPPADFVHDWGKTRTLVGTWEYRLDGQLYGHVARFKRSNGELVDMARTWCVDQSDGRGLQRWHWKGWEEPKPLYVPRGAFSAPEAALPVVVVGSEEHALAGHQLLGAEFDFVSWPGGAVNATRCAWAWLHGRSVVLWPDCDAKRAPRTEQDIAAGVPPEAKEVMPEARQPGFRAMQKIGNALVAEHACTVRLVRLPAPGAVPAGWGLTQAVAGGWGAEELRGMIRTAWTFEARAVAADPPPLQFDLGPAQPEPVTDSTGVPLDTSVEPEWLKRLQRGARGRKEDCRENVYLFLQHHSDLRGLVGYDEFAARVMKLRDPPWHTGPAGQGTGEWTTNDDYQLGLWLAENAQLLIKAEGTLVAGVAMAAMANQFHPVRDWFASLPPWNPDKDPERLAHWLAECLGAEDSTYTRLVGTWFVMGIAARVLWPGCQMDYMIVLEGLQGKRKSTALRVLSIRPEWFADTPIRVGDKDALLSLAGILLYEVGELDAFSRAEVTAVKQYITSRKDRVREPYGRRFVDRPRSGVLAGSTNQSEYFKDPTGNRRMWPVACNGRIDLDKLRAWVPALYAEALWRLRCPGEDERAREIRRYWPTLAETRQYLEPEQEKREIVDAWYEVLAEWVESPRKYADTVDEVRDVASFSTQELLRYALHVPTDRIDGNRQMATRVGQAMHKLGWERRRDAAGARLYRYWRPRPQAGQNAGAIVNPATTGPTAARPVPADEEQVHEF